MTSLPNLQTIAAQQGGADIHSICHWSYARRRGVGSPNDDFDECIDELDGIMAGKSLISEEMQCSSALVDYAFMLMSMDISVAS